MLHIDHQHRIVFHSCVTPLEPVIEPAHGLVAPFDARTRHRIVRKRVVPRTHDCFDRTLRLHEHVGHIIAIAIEQPAD